jgi:hypothetical protein
MKADARTLNVSPMEYIRGNTRLWGQQKMQEARGSRFKLRKRALGMGLAVALPHVATECANIIRMLSTFVG